MSGPLSDSDAAGILDSGGVLIMGTDTLPGFHCRADRPAAVARIFAIKGRRPGKAVLLLAGSLEQAMAVTGHLEARQAAFCRLCWPGPFSLILPAGSGLEDLVTGGGPTVAIRVPALPALRDMVLGAGHPLVSTSVNREGEPPLMHLRDAVAGFAQEVDGWWDPRSGKSPDGVAGSTCASALADLTVWPPRLLREGPLPLPRGASGGS